MCKGYTWWPLYQLGDIFSCLRFHCLAHFSGIKFAQVVITHNVSHKEIITFSNYLRVYI